MNAISFRLAALLPLLLPAVLFAAEPWADSRLPIDRGLAVWLDASRQPAARLAAKRASLEDGALFDIFYDAAGAKLDLSQRVQAAQPRFRNAGDLAVIRFDGTDDFLAATGLRRQLKEMTVVIVAAPRGNPGFFRAFLSLNEAGKNDYTSGFNIDLTGNASDDFSAVNIEGAGFQGAVNQMRDRHSLGGFHIITASVGAPGDKGVELFVDGAAQNPRKRTASTMRMDDLTLAARYYSNDGDPPRAGCFLNGDIAEVLLFDRALREDERGKVEDYLRDKHAALLRLKPGEPLEAAGRPAIGVPLKFEQPGGTSGIPVQMLVPGFTVRELPVKLTNINNLRYRHDGKLIALGYDGRIHLLTDTDSDGLEDKATLFWDKPGSLRAPIGMAITPVGYKHGNGVFVNAKGKVALIVDTDGDDKADKEIIVAQWKEGWHGVDGVGVALAPDGSIYYGVGCANFANAYLTDNNGENAKYDLKSELGTIQKVAPDFSKRETVCTGVRFTIALAFNKHGDLFASDQEGETWLPGGNPLDELLLIEKGKHYGFPPRHAKHLPNVVDAPAVELYGPQHQSTCGMMFNEHLPAAEFPKWKTFGPEHWKGDLLVTGESRGKIYRTTLTKAQGASDLPGGYKASTSLIAALSLLTVDVCVSPAGDMLIACHSGPPDWGTGPAGMGRLFKVSYTSPAAPQPVNTWAASPVEVRIAFDKAIDAKSLAAIEKSAEITYGEYVRAGDRFEVMRPPYEAVKQQVAQPRFNLRIVGAALSEDRKTLVLRTDPHPAKAWYAVRLPDVSGTKETIDVAYSLHGIDADWVPRRGALIDLAKAPPAVGGADASLAGGNWLRGQKLFRDEAKCASCHQLRGEGRFVGPDLSNLGHRETAAIIRDIYEPSAAINPDHVTYTVTLRDETEITGVLRSEPGDKLRVIDSTGKDTVLAAADVTSFRASALSTMPTGYDKQITGDKLKDLLAFLREPPPSMPRDLDGAPPARSRAEVEAVLKGSTAPPSKQRAITIVLVAGRKDHGKGEHDYPAWQKAWSRLLAMAEDVKVELAWDFPSPEQIKKADSIVFYQQGTWNKERAIAIDAYLARGGGLTYIHYAVDGGAEGPEFAKRIGFSWGAGSRFRHGPLELVFSTDRKNAITRNLAKARFLDESYWNLTGDASKVTTLATGDEDGKPQPLFWSYEKEGGRVFVSILGHYSWTFDDPIFRVVLLRGIAWSANESVDRLNDLVWSGASVKE